MILQLLLDLWDLRLALCISVRIHCTWFHRNSAFSIIRFHPFFAVPSPLYWPIIPSELCVSECRPRVSIFLCRRGHHAAHSGIKITVKFWWHICTIFNLAMGLTLYFWCFEGVQIHQARKFQASGISILNSGLSPMVQMCLLVFYNAIFSSLPKSSILWPVTFAVWTSVGVSVGACTPLPTSQDGLIVWFPHCSKILRAFYVMGVQSRTMMSSGKVSVMAIPCVCRMM